MNTRLKQITFSLLGLLFGILITNCSKEDDDPSKVKDFDGNIYNTITIGTQVWMVENLRTTTYNDGTPIPYLRSNDEWKQDTKGGYCNYMNTNNPDTIKNYGRLYNWRAVNTGKLSPKGWHIPSMEEWVTLQNYLGGSSVAGGKLKDLLFWQNPNTGATNESGFKALPGGRREVFGYFQGMGLNGSWWSTTSPGVDYILCVAMDNRYSFVAELYTYSGPGYSLRCLKD